MNEYDLISALQAAHNQTISMLKSIKETQLIHSGMLGLIIGAVLTILFLKH